MTDGVVSVLVREDFLTFLKTFAVIGIAAVALAIIFAIKIFYLKDDE